jgi:glycosyltransferase involved in cell wall biosynthesis
MRVGLVSTLTHGGPVEHMLTLARGLADSGVEVEAVCAASEIAVRLEAVGARAHVVPVRHGLDVRGARALRRCLQRVDVQHAQDRRSGLWVRLLPATSPRAVRVYTVHGLPGPYLPPPAGPAGPGLRAAIAYRGIDAGLARRADAVVTQTRALERALVGRLGWPADRMTVIPNGVELGEPLASRGHAIGTLSTFEPVKGLDCFLDSAALLAERRLDLRFLLFGVGSLDGALHSRSLRLGIGSRVGFPGWIPTREALGQLAVLVLPSHMENAPLVLLEAMAAGVPVVATRVGGIPELAPPGTAVLVAPGDAAALAAAVERLLDDPAHTAAQVAAARDHVQRHGSADAMIRRTRELYGRLLGTPA